MAFLLHYCCSRHSAVDIIVVIFSKTVFLFCLKFKADIKRTLPQYHFIIYVAGDQTVTFSQVVLEVMRHLEGAYALIFKSRHYPNELIACKRGSPLLLGVKVSYISTLCNSKSETFELQLVWFTTQSL